MQREGVNFVYKYTYFYVFEFILVIMHYRLFNCKPILRINALGILKICETININVVFFKWKFLCNEIKDVLPEFLKVFISI